MDLTPQYGKGGHKLFGRGAVLTMALVRRYLNSKSDAQLRGGSMATASLHSSCSPQDLLNGSSSAPIDPCGLVAWSNFNDTFQVSPSESRRRCCGGLRNHKDSFQFNRRPTIESAMLLAPSQVATPCCCSIRLVLSMQLHQCSCVAVLHAEHIARYSSMHLRWL